MNYQFDFHFLGGSLPALLDGLKVTLELALVSNLIGLVAGFGLSLMTLSRWFFIRWPAQLFVEFFRCTRRCCRSCGSSTACRCSSACSSSPSSWAFWPWV